MAGKKNADLSKGVRIFGVRLTLETDIVAALALVISVIGGGWQLYEFLTSGPRTVLLPPDQVFLFRAPASDGQPRLHLVMNFAYVNSGPEKHDDIVLHESVRLRIAGKTHEYGWNGFGTIEGELGDNLRFTSKAQSLPFTVPGRGAVTHQTSIVPWPVDCSKVGGTKCDHFANHVRWLQFIEHLKSLVKRNERVFPFELVAYLAKRKPVPTECKIEVSNAIIQVIDQYGAYNPTCFPVKGDGWSGPTGAPPVGGVRP